MTLRSAARQSLASVMAAALLLGSAAPAGATLARVQPQGRGSAPGIFAPAGPVSQGFITPDFTLLGTPLQTTVNVEAAMPPALHHPAPDGHMISGVLEIPQAAPGLKPPALAEETALRSHAALQSPVLSIVDALQRGGLDLAGRQEPAQALAAAQSLPPGAVRDTVVAFARLLAGPQGGVGSDLGRTYDNAAGAGMTGGSVTATPADGPAASGLSAPAGSERFLVAPEAMRFVPELSAYPRGTADAPAGQEGEVLGQGAETLANLAHGLARTDKHSNVVVSGPESSGRGHAIMQTLRRLAPSRPTPDDLVSAPNFADLDRPVTLELEPGRGKEFSDSVAELVKAVGAAVYQEVEQGAFARQKAAVLAQVHAGLAAVEKELNEPLASVRFGKEGKFTAKVFVHVERKGPAAFQIMAGNILLYEGKPVPFNEEEAKYQAFLSAHGLTAAEVEEARSFEGSNEAVQKAAQAGQGFVGLLLQTEKELDAAEAKVAAGIISGLAGPLKALAGRERSHDDAAHREWKERADGRIAEVERLHGRVTVGAYQLRYSMQGSRPAVGIYQGDELVQGEALQALQADQAAWGPIQAAIPVGLRAFLPAMLRAIDLSKAEHDLLHADDPPPAPAAAKAAAWVDELVADLAKNYKALLPRMPKNVEEAVERAQNDPAERYNTSAYVSNAAGSGAPIVFEANPTFERLFGTVETHRKVMVVGGQPISSKSGTPPVVKAGSFFKANGGYLILHLERVLREPGVYETLMNAVRTGEVELAEGGFMGRLYGRGDSFAVPAKVKIVLIGSPYLQMVLSHYDQDFARYFDHAIAFDSSVRIAADVIEGYLRFMKRMVASSVGEILEMSQGAVSALLEYAARISPRGPATLTTSFGHLAVMMREASQAARSVGGARIEREHVDAAVARKLDKGLYGRRLHEMMASGKFNIPMEGTAVGQMTGLAVSGNFGIPFRVSATAFVGKGEVVATDRQVDLAGPIFNKGVEISQGYLLSRFAADKPFPFTVRLTDEQSYNGIDGDSSTSTNLYAALSALSRVPIRQGIANTGSADQFGNVQVIGGVNEKIEGAFDVLVESLRRKGQTLQPGNHYGIMIPRGNVSDLMLRPDVVQAVREGKFRIWAVDHVSQGIEILTGIPNEEIERRINDRAEEVRSALRAQNRPGA